MGDRFKVIDGIYKDKLGSVVEFIDRGEDLTSVVKVKLDGCETFIYTSKDKLDIGNYPIPEKIETFDMFYEEVNTCACGCGGHWELDKSYDEIYKARL